MIKENRWRLGIMALCLIGSACGVAGSFTSGSKSDSSNAGRSQSTGAYARLPLSFEKNPGKADGEAQFLSGGARTRDAALPTYESRPGPWWQEIAREYGEFRQPDQPVVSPFLDQPDPFPFSRNANEPVLPHADGSVNLSISGNSQTASDLANEISARSFSKDDAFAQMRELARLHPDARVREQALVYLAGTVNDVTFSSIIEALADPDRGIRLRAMELLFQLGDGVPVQSLMELATRSQGTVFTAEVDAFVKEFISCFPVSQQPE